MKHIKRIFENKNDEQYDEITSIFYEFIDNDECEILKHENYISIEIYTSEISNLANSMDEIESIKIEYQDKINFINKVQISLKRIEFHNYSWTLKIEDHGIFIRVQKDNKKLSLSDAVKPSSVDEALMKKVCKDVYNLQFSSYIFRRGSSGYYGRPDEMLIYFSELISDDHQIIKDLGKIFPPYKIELVTWENSCMIKIKV